jgi:hypothetical protein
MDKTPWLSSGKDYGIRSGIPSGYEFSSLIEGSSCRRQATTSQEDPEKIQGRISRHIQVFVTLT